MSDFNSVASSAAIEHLRWSLTEQIGPILFSRLIERFGSAQAALGTSAIQLQSIEGIGATLAEVIARSREQVNLQAEVEQAAQHGVRIICQDDEAYPAPLRHIPDPPICLYYKGTLEPQDTVAVAIVGARRCSHYGREQARRFGQTLAQRGITVISGLARGIDGEAHRGALQGGGRTLAVLGNGLAKIYPPEHRELAQEIAQNGAILSELPMSTASAASNFLPRNRIIAGLSLGTLVVEAARRSGSLSTAARASEYNREVFAIPGRIDTDYSSGTNSLIRDQHAKLVMSADDILDELGSVGEVLRESANEETSAEAETLFSNSATPRTAAVNTLNERERVVFECLGSQEQSVETLSEQSGLSPAAVSSILIMLQLKGLARQLPGNLFVRRQ